MASSMWTGAASALGLLVCGAAGAHAIDAHRPALTLVSLLVGAGLTVSAAAAGGRLRRLPPVYDGSHAERVRRWLGVIVDRVPTPLIKIEGERLTAINRAARTLFETDDLIAPPVALADALAIVNTCATTLAFDGSDHCFQLAVSELEGLGRVASLTDITAEMRAAGAAATRDLMRVLSHEILNGMTPIASLAATAAALAHAPDANRAVLSEAVDTIARRAAGLVRFTHGFRELARLPPPERGDVPLDSLFDDIARLFIERWPDAMILLECKITTKDLVVLADQDQLAIALCALIDNAVDAIGARGGKICLDAVRSGAATSITVSDSGPGVHPDRAQVIFEPFFSTKATGSGVGLSLARDILRAHGGDLQLIQGNQRLGATFRATLG